MKRAALVVALALAVIGAVIGGSFAAAPAQATEARRACGFPEGSSRWLVRWETRAAVSRGGLQLSGDTSVSGTLNLERQGATLYASLADLSSAKVVALGESLATAAQLEGKVAQAQLDEHGHVTSYAFAPGTPEVTADVLQWLLNEAQVPCAPEGRSEWTSVEPAVLGEAQTDWAVTSKSTWSRRHVRFFALRSLPNAPRLDTDTSGAVRFAPDGSLEALESSDRLSGEGVELTALLRLYRTTAERPVALARPAAQGLETRRATEQVVSAGARRRLLELRADGMTSTRVIETLRSAKDGVVERHSQFLVRASAALALDPAAAKDLVPLSDAATPEQRALIADVLVAADEQESRRALVTLLDGDAARSDPAYSSLVQRIGLVRPDDETAAFALQRFDETSGAAHVGLAWSLAAIGRSPQGAEGLARLRAEVDAASGEDKGALLAALANAGDPADVPRALAGLADSDPNVRRGAALAAQPFATDAVTDALVEGLADASPAVSMACAASLAARQLSAAQLLRIEQLVALNAVPAAIEPQLAQLLARQQGPAARSALQTLLAHAPSGDVALFIRDVLAQR